jgi:hypothetical protein
MRWARTVTPETVVLLALSKTLPAIAPQTFSGGEESLWGVKPDDTRAVDKITNAHRVTAGRIDFLPKPVKVPVGGRGPVPEPEFSLVNTSS